jgi:hypothetical protein
LRPETFRGDSGPATVLYRNFVRDSLSQTNRRICSVFGTRILPVVAATSGALQPEILRLLFDFARLKTDAAEQHAVANSQRRGTTFARLRSYTDHWEALGCALCLFTAPEISSTGPVRGRGFCLASR